MSCSLSTHNLTCEYRENPIGLTRIKPRLFWTDESTLRGQYQTRYQILVASILAEDIYNSIHVKIRSAWQITGKSTKHDFSIPANTTAVVVLQTHDPYAIREGGIQAMEAEGVTFEKYEKGAAVFNIVSGTYQFVVPLDSVERANAD